MQHTHTHTAAGLCSKCFGFPVVKVATGKRTADGSRPLGWIICGDCKGTGNAPAATPSARVAILSGATT